MCRLDHALGWWIGNAGIPYQLTNVTWRMERLALVIGVTIANKIFLVDNIR
jgi:hypothetical protein